MAYKKVKILMEQVTGAKQYLAVQMIPLYSYQDGRRTDQQIGFRMEVVEMGNFEKFWVKIMNLSPKLSAEMLKGTHDRIYVRFIEGYATPYINGRNIDYSFTATDVEIVKKSTASVVERG